MEFILPFMAFCAFLCAAAAIAARTAVSDLCDELNNFLISPADTYLGEVVGFDRFNTTEAQEALL